MKLASSLMTSDIGQLKDVHANASSKALAACQKKYPDTVRAETVTRGNDTYADCYKEFDHYLGRVLVSTTAKTI